MCTKIGNTFILEGPNNLTKHYTHYATNYDKSREVLKNVEKKSSFQSFQKKCRENPRVQRLEMSAFLIMPIQRIPRYELMLKDLLKFTWPEHPDYDNLTKALDMVSHVNREINFKKKQSDYAIQIANVEKKVKGIQKSPIHKLVEPHRKLVKDGNLALINDNNKEEQVQIFLFNDVLMITSRKKAKV